MPVSDADDGQETFPVGLEGTETIPHTTPNEVPVSSVRENLTKTVRNVAAAAQEQVSSLGEDVGAELSKAAEKQKTRGVEGIRVVAGAMNSAAAELEKSSPKVAEHVRTASKSVADLSHAIDGRDVKELFQQGLLLAKANPVLFFAGALAGGFLISRFLKSSSEG